MPKALKICFPEVRRGRLALWVSAAFLSLDLCLPILVAGTDSHSGTKAHIHVVCSSALFRGVSPSELVSSAKLWVQSIGNRVGLIIDPEITIVDNAGDMRRRVDEGTADLFASSSLEYLALDRSSVLEPAVTMTAGSGEKGKIKYLLLVNRDGGIAQLADLKGKVLNTYARSDSNLNRLWLDVFLRGAHLPPADQLLKTVAATSKPSTACLPLFFGKADACMIDDPSWETLRELNPQLEKKLTILAESKPMIESLISFTHHYHFVDEMYKGLLGLKDAPDGAQVLLFFKCRQAVAIDKGDLAYVSELRSTYVRDTRPSERKFSLPTVNAVATTRPSKVD